MMAQSGETGSGVRSIGWSHSQGLHVRYSAVIVVANESGQAGSADLIQLFQRERAGLIGRVVKVTIGVFDPEKLIADDAGGRGTNTRITQRRFGQTADVQINVIDRFVDSSKTVDGLEPSQVLINGTFLDMENVETSSIFLQQVAWILLTQEDYSDCSNWTPEDVKSIDQVSRVRRT